MSYRVLRCLNWFIELSAVHNRRLLTARNARMSSVELPDENEKSVSSASTSPCHSPVSYNAKQIVLKLKLNPKP